MAAHFQATEEKWPSSSISHIIIHQLLGENRKSVLHCKCFSILVRSERQLLPPIELTLKQVDTGSMNQNGAPVLTEDSINRGDIVSTVGVAVKIKVNDASVDGDAGDVVMRTEIMDCLASVEGESIQERADGFDKADVIQVSNGGGDKVNEMKDEGKLPVIDVDLTDSE
uniref:Uncharacterized protein n=1 Tax=Salix viminalis TaxID=40686 RepID=A0A6N2KGA1_SALVM